MMKVRTRSGMIIGNLRRGNLVITKNFFGDFSIFHPIHEIYTTTHHSFGNLDSVNFQIF